MGTQPQRREVRLACAGVAVLLFVLLSLAFSWFVRTFTAYSAYGSLDVVIAFMTWLWVSMVIVLFGGLLYAECEHQTICDFTTGAQSPWVCEAP